MRRRYRLTNRAQADIEEIGRFIAADNPPRARSFVRELRQRCVRISDHPQAAPLRSEFGEGVRMVTLGRYLILYTMHDEDVVIERVVHGARDPKRLA